jgi:hypothetical protein
LEEKIAMKNIELKQTVSCCASSSSNQEVTMQEPNIKLNKLPVAIIGAGPIGLAAAANLVEHGENFILFESGSQVGNNISDWGHVRLFSPWQYNVDKAAAKLLTKRGWSAPSPEELPTGQELLENYLLPLADLPEISSQLILNTKVIGIGRKDTDKMKSKLREIHPFVIYAEVEGTTQRYEAKAVIDASGTWGNSNPLYANGVWTNEERSLNNNIYYGIPNIHGRDKERYIGKASQWSAVVTLQ